jgi:glutamate N-acetyltransferase/amino-acid N-acetyltransferase
MSVPTVQTIETIGGGVATPKGFRAAGVGAGIKAKAGALDLALLVSDHPATAAAVFTTNLAQAAPVTLSRDHLSRSDGVARAVIVNSGCANACTGDQGHRDAMTMARETAALIGCPVEQVLVASTGVIGVALPMEKIHQGLPVAFNALGSDQGALAAQAIMTTDPFPKEAAARVGINGGDITIGGMAKGSGMIEPMLATMLGFVTTDARVPKALLDRARTAPAESASTRAATGHLPMRFGRCASVSRWASFAAAKARPS